MIRSVKRTLRHILHIAQHMGIDHGRLDALVTQQVLYLPNIYAAHQQMRCKAMAQRVDGHMFHDACLLNSISMADCIALSLM